MSTLAHITLSDQQFLTKNGMAPMTHPPYSQISPRAAFLGSLDETVLKGIYFANVEEVK